MKTFDQNGNKLTVNLKQLNYLIIQTFMTSLSGQITTIN